MLAVIVIVSAAVAGGISGAIVALIENARK